MRAEPIEKVEDAHSIEARKYRQNGTAEAAKLVRREKLVVHLDVHRVCVRWRWLQEPPMTARDIHAAITG